MCLCVLWSRLQKSRLFIDIESTTMVISIYGLRSTLGAIYLNWVLTFSRIAIVYEKLRRHRPPSTTQAASAKSCLEVFPDRVSHRRAEAEWPEYRWSVVDDNTPRHWVFEILESLDAHHQEGAFVIGVRWRTPEGNYNFILQVSLFYHNPPDNRQVSEILLSPR